MNFVCLSAQFYVALYPIGGPYLSAYSFFQAYLAGPFLVVLYLGWKVWSWFKHPAHRPFYIKIADIDIYTGIRDSQIDLIGGPSIADAHHMQGAMEIQENQNKKGVWNWTKAVVASVL
jgi:yeast amino acid transporter